MDVRTGVWVFPSAPAPELLAAIEQAEHAGLDEFWVGDEGLAREPFSLLAAAAVRTRQIRLGVAVTNPYVRPPALTAATAKTIAELAGEGRAGERRFALGVGAGGSLALSPFGLRAEHPLARVRDALGAFAEVGGGAFPIFVGARGEKLNRLASERAEGAFVAGLPPRRYGEVIGWCRSVRAIDIALYPSVAFTAGDVETSRPEMIWTLVDAPAHTVTAVGADPAEVAAAAKALASGDDGPARAVMTDEVLDEVLLRGTADAVARRLAELVAEHRPASIGLALPQSALGPAIDAAAEALRGAVGR